MESEKMELRLINPNESGFLQHIEWNSEEIRKQVQMMMSAYTDVVYTEDTMKAAKDDSAWNLMSSSRKKSRRLQH